MNCAEAYDKMLIAEPSDLHGHSDPALAEHLASCAACRTRATRLGVGLRELSAAVLARDLMMRRRHRRRLALLGALPIAAALVLAVTLVVHRRATDTPVTPAVPFTTAVSVDVSPGQRAAVFATSDPAVTVVWLSPGVGQ
jgi:hypothetical protein